MNPFKTKLERENSVAAPWLRHCSYCLRIVELKDVMFCTNCKKRPYCGEDCLKKDFNKGDGQWHKNWCGLDTCEEDIDWAVVPVEGKGLGIIARRFIPARHRILVEGICSENSSIRECVQDLLPRDGTYQEKVRLNGLSFKHSAGRDSSTNALCVRISRANHACNFNANHYYDEKHKVMILFSERDIQPGDEICISYRPFQNYPDYKAIEIIRLELFTEYGIICPLTCICHNDGLQTLLQVCQDLDSRIPLFVCNQLYTDALKSVKELLEVIKACEFSAITLKRTLYDAFQIANLAKGVPRREIRGYMEENVQLNESFHHPRGEEILKFKSLLRRNKRR